ncbi:MAG: PAS domain-containing sensor histidine kinase [Agathobacter sp.]|nr:PAS domain-containing sensor histidine kinase [Agathobacter sp.]
MTKYKQTIQDGIFTAFILVVSYFFNFIMQFVFETNTLVPTIFVLGVFFVSLRTEGYFWGVSASLASVILVNFTFTAPYYAIDLITPVNMLAAAVMLVVAVMTSTLTTQVKLQEKIKAESEKERMRGNLLRAVSHDLRTPLTSIYGSSSVIMENYDSLSKEQQMKLLGEIHEDSQWLIRMVENLLSVTRIDDSVARVTKTSTVLEELIDAVLVKFHKHYPNQQIEVEIPEDFISIPMDAMLIEQVLINILENAIIHAEGMTELKLSVRVEMENAIFEVEDNGCGIPEDKLAKLFTGYLERDNAPTDGTRNNMGIGLSVCSTIIKAHGGEVFARNREEGGAVFGFSLAMEVEDEQQ